MRYGNKMYNKLFTKILDSSVWLQPLPTRVVWITFLASMDQDGFVAFSGPGNVARRSNVGLDEAAAALAYLENPDAESVDDPQEGRRIQRVPGGWLVLNAAKYGDVVTRSDQRETTRLRVARFRARKACNVTGVTPLQRNDSVTPSDTEAEADTDSRARTRAGGPPESRPSDAAPPAAPAAIAPTAPGLACQLLKAEAGMADVNPSHAGLLMALAEGITPEALRDLALELKGSGKPTGFAYLIKTARSRWAERGKLSAPVTASADPAAAGAWDLLLASDGAAQSDARIRKALEACGGWMPVRMRTSFDAPRLKAAFCRAYLEAGK